MNFSPENIEKQIKEFAKKLDDGVEVNASLLSLSQLNAPLEMYGKYNVKELTYRFINQEEFGVNARLLKKFLRCLKKAKRTAKKLEGNQQSSDNEKCEDYDLIEGEQENEENKKESAEKNFKRRATSPMNTQAKILRVEEIVDRRLAELEDVIHNNKLNAQQRTALVGTPNEKIYPLKPANASVNPSKVSTVKERPTPQSRSSQPKKKKQKVAPMMEKCLKMAKKQQKMFH